MKQIRGVTIELRDSTWLVLYVNRKKYQHYTAAQFYSKDHSKSSVVEWVKSQPNLKLIQ